MLLTLKNNGITESELSAIMGIDYLVGSIEDEVYIHHCLDIYSQLEFEERNVFIDDSTKPSNIIQFPQFNSDFEPKDPAVSMAA